MRIYSENLFILMKTFFVNKETKSSDLMIWKINLNISKQLLYINILASHLLAIF